ncbi:MAG: hypothetical protein FJX44_05700 [Alphaproteobacteria bacterium]|nr:hypothetical protein [Alphaproteobacteria bacterium]
MILTALYRAVEPMSTSKAAAAGGAGAGVSLTAAMIDPGAASSWLHLLTLVIGSLTGLASFTLVALKIVQQWRAMRSPPPPPSR